MQAAPGKRPRFPEARWSGELPSGLLAAGAWDEVPGHYVAQGLGKGTATSFTREAREFHILGADTLWITFARGQLWWAFAEPDVMHREGGVQPNHATQ